MPRHAQVIDLCCKTRKKRYSGRGKALRRSDTQFFHSIASALEILYIVELE